MPASEQRASGRRALIKVALGTEPADLIIRGGRIVNVYTGEIHRGDVAVKGRRIASIGDVDHTRGDKTLILEADGRYVCPGLVDGHLHMYHSYLGVNEFVETMLRHGVTATADGFYGQGIVGGLAAVRFFKDAFDGMPIRLLFLVPTLAYLQNRELGLTPASGLSAEDMFTALEWEGCRGLEEPPPLPIAWEWDEFIELFEQTLDSGKVISGHAIGTPGQLQAYIAMGAASDHETVAYEDGLIKARSGMKLFMREGSGCTNVAELARLVTEQGIDPTALGFCADVASPEKLARDGGVDENIRVAVSRGVPPIQAVRMASLSVAQTFRVDHDLGSVAPGRYADIVLVDDLARFSVSTVLVGGRTVVDDDRLVIGLPPTSYPRDFLGTVRLERPVNPSDLEVRVDQVEGEVLVRVMGVTDGSLITTEEHIALRVEDGVVQPDPSRGIQPIAMVDRLGKGTGIGLGFVQGFGLERGAVGSTVNAVCENVIVVGADSQSMAVAVNHLAEIGGGKVVVDGQRVRATVELRLLGLLSDEPLDMVMSKFTEAFAAIADQGCALTSAFSTLEFCGACGEIGDLKISEEGLVRTDPPGRVPLLVTADATEV